MLGCGLPGGEPGYNMGRVVATLLGMDHLPGCTITRYCSSSLQTTRMAYHAIKAGEGDVFISAGVETVSRFVKGCSDGLPETHNEMFAEAQKRTDTAAAGGVTWHDPRAGRRRSRTSTSRWARPPRTWRSSRASPAQDQDEFGVRSQNLAEKAIADGFWATRDHAGHPAGRHRRRQRRRPARRRHLGEDRDAQAGVPPRRHGHRRQLLPAERRRGRAGDHVRHQGARAGSHAAGPDRVDRRLRRCRRRSWASGRSRRRSRRWSGPG